MSILHAQSMARFTKKMIPETTWELQCMPTASDSTKRTHKELGNFKKPDPSATEEGCAGRMSTEQSLTESSKTAVCKRLMRRAIAT